MWVFKNRKQRTSTRVKPADFTSDESDKESIIDVDLSFDNKTQVLKEKIVTKEELCFISSRNFKELLKESVDFQIDRTKRKFEFNKIAFEFKTPIKINKTDKLQDIVFLPTKRERKYFTTTTDVLIEKEEKQYSITSNNFVLSKILKQVFLPKHEEITSIISERILKIQSNTFTLPKKKTTKIKLSIETLEESILQERDGFENVSFNFVLSKKQLPHFSIRQTETSIIRTKVKNIFQTCSSSFSLLTNKFACQTDSLTVVNNETQLDFNKDMRQTFISNIFEFKTNNATNSDLFRLKYGLEDTSKKEKYRSNILNSLNAIAIKDYGQLEAISFDPAFQDALCKNCYSCFKPKDIEKHAINCVSKLPATTAVQKEDVNLQIYKLRTGLESKRDDIEEVGDALLMGIFKDILVISKDIFMNNHVCI